MQHSPKLFILYLLRTDKAWHLEYIFSLAEGEKRKAFQIYVIISTGPRCCWTCAHCPAASKGTSAGISGSAWYYQLAALAA